MKTNMISLICGIQKKKTDTNELMHKTETNPQTQKTNTITKGEREERDKLGV